MKNRIYTIKVDSNLDEELRKFEKQLNPEEEIIDTTLAKKDLLIIVTKESENKNKNLLLE
jgi:hypothetical protein